jgi:hypothetical protein
MINLESVGTGISEDGMCYPMLADGGYDYENGTHVAEYEGDEGTEWRRNLSKNDRKVVIRFITKLLRKEILMSASEEEIHFRGQPKQ